MFRVDTEAAKAGQLLMEAQFSGKGRLDLTGSGPLKCLRPAEIMLIGHPDALLVYHGIERDRRASVRMDVRCRKCEGCLKHRARLWTARAMAESKASVRTWFGTLTLSPERQVWARYAAISKLSKGGVKDPTPDDIFRVSANIVGEELTKFLKRVRKVQQFRYLLVTESHKSGLPHFHALIHEYTGTVTKRTLESRWNFGFSHWRLIVNDNAASYACKYLAKSALTRVRASGQYGQGGQTSLLTERVIDATHELHQSLTGRATL